jgi:hypothetical protein
MTTFPKKYNCLKKQIFKKGDYKIIPIRYEDRYMIMEWRNEQRYHLRQEKILTKKDQNNYFFNVISKLFVKKNPEQILFSFLKNEQLIGYGGLVHINWNTKNAEMSFLIHSNFSKECNEYQESLTTFIHLIKKVVFKELLFKRLFTETYSMRDFHIKILETNLFMFERKIIEKINYEGIKYDSLIHSINKV